MDEVLQQRQENQKILEAAQVKELESKKLGDELENTKAQLQELKDRDKAMVQLEKKGASALLDAKFEFTFKDVDATALLEPR